MSTNMYNNIPSENFDTSIKNLNETLAILSLGMPNMTLNFKKQNLRKLRATLIQGYHFLLIQF